MKGFLVCTVILSATYFTCLVIVFLDRDIVTDTPYLTALYFVPAMLGFVYLCVRLLCGFRDQRSEQMINYDLICRDG